MRSALARLAATAAAVAAVVTMPAVAPAPASAAPPPPPPPTVAPTLLTGVWCASVSNCLAVGGSNETAISIDGAQPLAERWNGKTWRKVAVRPPAGASLGSFIRLTCRSATWCVAVGFYAKGGADHELADFWNGRTWTPTEPPAPAGSSTRLTDVSCLSARNCVAVGMTSAGTAGTQAVVEKWNGTKWARVTAPVPAGFSDLASVSCPSPKFCVAVGTVGGVLVESWNGTAWRRVSAPSPVARDDTDTLVSVSCASPSDCVAVGDAIGTGSAFGFAETWNGKAWRLARLPLPKSTDTDLFTVSCASGRYCAAVGNIGQDPTSARNAGRAAAMTWNGKAWALQPVPAPAKGTTSLFFGVSCRPATTCVAVGDIGPAGVLGASSLSGFWNGKDWRLVPAV